MIPRILIVDDEAPARARILQLLADIEDECPHRVAGQADSAASAVESIAALQPDIVLLDVQMPGVGGLELAAQLSRDGGPTVIFVTAYENFALQAFEVHAADYLLKPVRAARLAEAIRRASVRRPGSNAARSHFVVPERDRVLRVPVNEVLYLKAEQKYVTLRTSSASYLIEESLLSLEEELAARFVRVHRNALVAKEAICGVEKAPPEEGEADGWQVVLAGLDERLRVSRRQWPIIKALVR